MRKILALLPLLAVAAAPPANVQMANGQPRAVQPVAQVSAADGSAAPAGSTTDPDYTIATPAKASSAPTIAYTLGASQVTAMQPANANRIGLEYKVVSSPNAIVYLCYNGQANCSATVYDDFIPSGAAIRTGVTPLFATGAALYAYTTATGGPVIAATEFNK